MLRGLSVLFPLLLLGAFDQGLRRIFPYQGEMGYLRRAPGEPPLYFLERGKPRLYGELPLAKATNTLRVFTFGESSTWGLPYGAGGSFSGWMGLILNALDPTSRVEIVNTGYPSAPLATSRDFAEAAIPFQPDVFVIYSGNNEFLLENQVLREAAVDGALVHWLRRKLKYRSFLFFQLDRWYAGRRTKTYYRPENVRFEDYNVRVDDRFRAELRGILAVARRRHVRVVLCTVTCNERDYPPMQSGWQPGLNPTQVQACEALLTDMRQGIATGRYADAEALYAQLCAASPGYAQATYELAQMYLRTGNALKAQQAFRRAKEEDRTLVRVKARFDAIIRAEAQRAVGPDVALVDIEHILATAAPQGVPGNEFFLDGMHPTLRGHFLIALEVVRAMTDRGWAPTRKALGPEITFDNLRPMNQRFDDAAILETGGYFVGLGRRARAKEIFRDFLREHEHWQAHYNLAVIALEEGDRATATAETAAAYRLLSRDFRPIAEAVQVSAPKWASEFERLRTYVATNNI